jgi:hypothetical protein
MGDAHAPGMQDDRDLEKLAKRRVQARFGFAIHAALYVCVNAGLFAIWMLTGGGYPWFVWPMLGWGMGIVAHGIALLIGPDTPAEQRAIEREVQRLRAMH